MIISDDQRVMNLGRFASDCCYEQRTDYYSRAMRAVGVNRGQIGGLLYAVNLATYKWFDGLLLTSVIRKKDQDWPGDGYFGCAVDLGLLAPGADTATQRAFWDRQLSGLFAVYADDKQLDRVYANYLRMRRN